MNQLTSATVPPTVKAAMPDVAIESQAQLAGKINWVGMSQIDVPIQLPAPMKGTSDARVQAYVSLDDPAAKGIHMSRLYLALDDLLANQPLSPALISSLLGRFLETHTGLSNNAFVELRFNAVLRRNALLSDNSGFKRYPSFIRGSRRGDEIKLEVGVDVEYSSTCPCSAALARQLIQEGFEETFGSEGKIDADAVKAWLGTIEGIRATPHSQRSRAQLIATVDSSQSTFPFLQMIDAVETALGTPVQTAVKRVDEQEFARLNGQNLMFCEDAVRRVSTAMGSLIAVEDFWVRVNHFESLHAHDAVAVATKGIEGGYSDAPGVAPTL